MINDIYYKMSKLQLQFQFTVAVRDKCSFGQLEPLYETLLRSNPPENFFKRGNTYALFQFQFTSAI